MNINGFAADYTPPDIRATYHCSVNTADTGFTLLHKLVWFPDLLREYKTEDTNVRTTSGWTALMLACRNGCTDSVSILLACPGINVNCASTDGWTALMMSCRCINIGSNVQIVQHLLAHPGIHIDTQEI